MTISDTFTCLCPWGCTIHVQRGKEQPHTCAGTSLVVDAMRTAPDDATVLEYAEHIARAIDPDVREQRGLSWEDGVRSGRSGLPCVGVDTEPETNQPKEGDTDA